MRPTEFIDPFQGRTGIFHLASDHLESNNLFKTDDCFRYGVNTLALCVAQSPVSLLCYELMGSHLHTLLKGTWPECHAFFRRVLHRLAIMVAARDGISGVLPRDGFDVHPVMDVRQFKNEVIYILRNCYKARIDSPFSYPWGSTDVYFNPFRDLVPSTPVSHLGIVETRKLFRTHVRIPGHYVVYDGRILNRCFVDYPYVEKQFGDSLSFFDAMRIWDLESSVALSHGAAEKVSFSDAELELRLKVICQEEYHVHSPQALDRKSLLQLARTASRRFGAGKAQLARLLNLSTDMLGIIL